MPSQNMPLIHKDYFKLKATEKEIKKSSLPSPIFPKVHIKGFSVIQMTHSRWLYWCGDIEG